MSEKKKFKVGGMSCAACSARVTRAVEALDLVDSCEVNLLLGSMQVSGTARSEDVIRAVEEAGYTASEEGDEAFLRDADGEEKSEARKVAVRLLVSALFMLLLSYISMGHNMWGFPLPSFLSKNPLANGICQLVLSTVIIVINRRFFVSGVLGAVRLAPNMDTLVATGSGASYIYSVARLISMASADGAFAYEILHGLYFESSAMILVLITVGKLLEAHAKGRTASALRSLMSLSPKEAVLERDGKEIRVPVDELSPSDVVVVRRGENISADGVVIFGAGSVDESLLTGESIPSDKGVGDEVFCGCPLTSGFIKIKVTKTKEESALAEIIKMVKDTSATKAPVSKIADKVAGVFVPCVMLIATVAFFIWMLVGAEFGYALERGISVLVISCPCALGLATPVAIMVGSGVGARLGILFKNATALEVSGRIKIVALDKTGTITEGQPYITDIYPIAVSEAELLAIASSVERRSEHPIAQAIVRGAEERFCEVLECTEFRQESGGVSGIVAENRIFAGNKSYIESLARVAFKEEETAQHERLSGMGKTVIAFAKEGEVLGIIAVADRIKSDSCVAISELHKMGIETVMITGDNRSCALAIAEEVGIKRVVAEVLPNDKAREVASLCELGRVAMIGDGVNDAVALTRADVGIAVGCGAQVAVDSADVVLVGGTLTDAVRAIKLGRKTLLNIYENLFWAFCYNIVGIPLAAGAFVRLFGWTLAPAFSAAAMSVSSLLVVMNALRLNLFERNKKITPMEISVQRETSDMKTVTIKIEGMMCPHCSGRVKSALEALPEVAAADVSHERKDAVIELAREVEIETLEAVISDTGYKVIK